MPHLSKHETYGFCDDANCTESDTDGVEMPFAVRGNGAAHADEQHQEGGPQRRRLNPPQVQEHKRHLRGGGGATRVSARRVHKRRLLPSSPIRESRLSSMRAPFAAEKGAVLTVGVEAESICVKVIVRCMYAALPQANVMPCITPIGAMLWSQNDQVGRHRSVTGLWALTAMTGLLSPESGPVAATSGEIIPLRSSRTGTGAASARVAMLGNVCMRIVQKHAVVNKPMAESIMG